MRGIGSNWPKFGSSLVSPDFGGKIPGMTTGETKAPRCVGGGRKIIVCNRWGPTSLFYGFSLREAPERVASKVMAMEDVLVAMEYV